MYQRWYIRLASGILWKWLKHFLRCWHLLERFTAIQIPFRKEIRIKEKKPKACWSKEGFISISLLPCFHFTCPLFLGIIISLSTCFLCHESLNPLPTNYCGNLSFGSSSVELLQKSWERQKKSSKNSERWQDGRWWEMWRCGDGDGQMTLDEKNLF